VTTSSEVLEAAATIDVRLPDAAAARLAAYLDAMLEENRRVNLTAIRDPGAALWLHAVDAVAIARVVTEAPAAVLDLGTGNGFPGVAAAALWPGCRVVLCDRTRKKVDAVQRALVAAGLRAETLWLDAAQAPTARPELRGAFDLVLARAVAEPVAVARLAAPLLAAGGRLVVWQTGDDHPPQMLAGDLRREIRIVYELRVPEHGGAGGNAADRRERALIAWRMPAARAR
jgi:16S rRNA (guanine527-N7)-methyltransferase